MTPGAANGCRRWHSALMLAGLVIGALVLPPLAAAQGKGRGAALNFGHITVEDPAAISIKYTPLLDLVAATIGRDIRLVQKSSYEGLQAAFVAGEVDFGILNCFSYLKLRREYGITPICRRVVNNRSTYQCYLIVRHDSPIRSYADLRGKVIAFSDPSSTSGAILPRLMLRQNGIDPEQDPARIIFVGKHDSAFFAILNWSADAAAVASHLFDATDAAIRNKIRILDQSIPVPLGPLVVRNTLPPDLKARLQAAFIGLDRTDAGRQVLQQAEVNRYEETSDADFDAVRALMAPFLE